MENFKTTNARAFWIKQYKIEELVNNSKADKLRKICAELNIDSKDKKVKEMKSEIMNRVNKDFRFVFPALLKQLADKIEKMD